MQLIWFSGMMDSVTPNPRFKKKSCSQITVAVDVDTNSLEQFIPLDIKRTTSPKENINSSQYSIYFAQPNNEQFTPREAAAILFVCEPERVIIKVMDFWIKNFFPYVHTLLTYLLQDH